MKIKVDKNTTPEQLKTALAALKITPEKHSDQNLEKFRGKLIRGLDGLAYQKSLRNEQD